MSDIDNWASERTRKAQERSNDKLFKSAMRAINDLFSDTSVSRKKAQNNLKALKDEIDILMDTL